MDSWYVVYTQPRSEDRAAWHLQNQGFNCFLPRFLKTRSHARKKDTVLEPLFPRYLFVKFDADISRWRSINGSRGVVSLLTDGVRPLPVPDSFVERLRTECDETGITSLDRIGVFAKGSCVRVTSGPFVGQVGEVADVLDKGIDRVRVLLRLLGVETCMQVPAHALETA